MGGSAQCWGAEVGWGLSLVLRSEGLGGGGSPCAGLPRWCGWVGAQPSAEVCWRLSWCRAGDGHWVSSRSGLPYEVSPEQALCHPEVQRRLDVSIRTLLTVTEKFVSAITSSVDQIPCVPRRAPHVPAARPREGRGGAGGFPSLSLLWEFL